MNQIKGWHSRGYLPHFDGGEITQFITFRLFDSLPRNVLEKMKFELRFENDDEREKTLLRQIDKFLDTGYGCCFLKEYEIAEIVEKKIISMDREFYHLKCWVIMANHVHLLFTPKAGISLSQIMKMLKGSTAKEANGILQRKGQFWQKDYFDRYIRDAEHFAKTYRYILNNPVKAGLCENPQDWRFGSAWHQDQEIKVGTSGIE